MRNRLPKNLMKYHRETVYWLWDTKSSELTMKDIAKILKVDISLIYQILKEAREAKEKEFHDHLTYKANPDFEKLRNLIKGKKMKIEKEYKNKILKRKKN